MKKIFTLCVLALFAASVNAQVVFNEVYTNPGASRHEFFEFYNTSINPTPESMDDYTVVTYFEEGGKFGFYVMDLPAQTVASKGYYVAASVSPFNIQGQNGLTPNFSWNAIPAGGSLKRFERNGATYNQVALPADLNNIFVDRAGNNATHNIFVFKNGFLVNGIFAGIAQAVIPSYIKAMPPLWVDMSGTSPDFFVDFNSFNDNQFEYIGSAPGNDNGYFRLGDGLCGVWNKSSSSAQHTPGVSNGSSGASGVSGALTIVFSITELGGDYTKALLTYNVTAATLSAFPVIIDVYQDLGTIGQLDAADVLVDTRILYTTTEGDQYVVLPSRTDPVILVAKTPSGCFDQVAKIATGLSPLPVHLLRFQGNMNKNNRVTLNWTVADNETVNSFEIERSFNGRDFTTVGIVFASEKRGNENYMFYETVNNNDKVMYRLKMIDKGHDVDYSRILIFQTKTLITSDIKVYGNPVKDKLTFSYFSNATQPVQVKVYDLTGKTLMSQKVNSAEGSNMLSLPLASTFKAGMYVVEVTNGSDRQVTKFVKQ
ncbi:MAG TPA: T9SS type A sorting domain-containing protein [Chitinophagaceae bacterium]